MQEWIKVRDRAVYWLEISVQINRRLNYVTKQTQTEWDNEYVSTIIRQ